jgi:hypothetical protein
MTSWTRRELWLLVLFCISAAATVVLATIWPTTPPAALVSPLPLPKTTVSFPTRETVVYATRGGDIVLHDVVRGQRVTVLAGKYKLTEGECPTCITLYAPMRASPDGKWLLIPTPADGTWLVATDGSAQRQVHAETIAPTWAPDSVHFAYMADPPDRADTSRALYIGEVTPGVAPRLLERFALASYLALWSPGCGEGPAAAEASCGQHIAVFVPEPEAATPHASTAWAVDVHTGTRRSIGAFVPPAVELGASDFRWSPTGDAVWVRNSWPAMGIDMALPLDGGPARPLVPACLFGCVPPTANTFYMESGWRILYKYGEAAIEAKSPLGENREVAKGIFFLGTFAQLVQRSTEVGEAAPLRALGTLPEWNDTKTQVVSTSGGEFEVTTPQHWTHFRRDEIQGVTNFELIGSSGMAMLTNEQILVTYRLDPTLPVYTVDANLADGNPIAPARADAFDRWLQALTETETAARNLVMAEPTWFSGVRAVRLWSALNPFAEQIIVPMRGNNLVITKWPLGNRENFYFRNFNVRRLGVVKTARIVRNASIYGGPDPTSGGFGTILCCRTLFLIGKNADGSWLQLQQGGWIEATMLDQVPSGLEVPEDLPYIGPG